MTGQFNSTVYKNRISTHTLTWSVTPLKSTLVLIILHFNSHAHVERDFKSKQSFIVHLNFNSHAHVERDYHFSTLTLYHVNFNSHAHVERDSRRGAITVRH